LVEIFGLAAAAGSRKRKKEFLKPCCSELQSA